MTVSALERARQWSQPSDVLRNIMSDEHQRLRERLVQDAALKSVVVTSVIAGSHARGTAIAPVKSSPCDVDVIVVTTFPPDARSIVEVTRAFQTFLSKNYPGRFAQRNRSWRIAVNPQVQLDLVPMAHVSGSAEVAVRSDPLRHEWSREQPLSIPDRTMQMWEGTHPWKLSVWTKLKDQRCNGHFTAIVRLIKWWWRDQQPQPQYLTGYPVERVVAECCPDGITSLEVGLRSTFKQIAERFHREIQWKTVPELPAVGLPSVNVLRRVQAIEFALLVAKARQASETIARQSPGWGFPDDLCLSLFSRP